MTDPDPLRAAAQAVVAKAELDDSGFDGECLDYLVPIPTLDALRAALAADTARPVGRNVQDVQDARPGLGVEALSPEWHAELALVEAESRNATLDEVVRVVEDIARQLAPSERAYYGIAAVLDAVKALRWLTS